MPGFLAKSKSIGPKLPASLNYQPTIMKRMSANLSKPKPKLSLTGVPTIPMNEVMSWEDWQASRKQRRLTVANPSRLTNASAAFSKANEDCLSRRLTTFSRT
jgi:hypothetical protein